MADQLPEKPPSDVGDVLEWMESPVVVIGRPWVGRSGIAVNESWLAKACYLRINNERIGYDVGQELTFTLGFAQPWTGELTDEESAMIARKILLSA
jgi:hypothetical protein